jgi:hypothetical protein
MASLPRSDPRVASPFLQTLQSLRLLLLLRKQANGLCTAEIALTSSSHQVGALARRAGRPAQHRQAGGGSALWSDAARVL